METTSFVLGMLTIVNLIFIVSTVLGMVKISSLMKKIKSLEKEVECNYTDSLRFLDDVREQINDISEVIEEENKKIVSYVDSRFDKTMRSKREEKS